MAKPSPHMRDMRNATAKKVMSQEGVDPDQDVDADADADADRGSGADFAPDRDVGSPRKKREEAPATPEPGHKAEGNRLEVLRRFLEESSKTPGDTGDTGDTGEDRFGGTFGAERVEAVAEGQEWEDKVTDAVHGHREKLQHEDPQGDGGDYELVEAVGNPPTELIFEGPDGQQYSVDYNTGDASPHPSSDMNDEMSRLFESMALGPDYEELSGDTGGTGLEEQGELINYDDLNEMFSDFSQRWSDTGDTGE